jgi:hypothetical protein
VENTDEQLQDSMYLALHFLFLRFANPIMSDLQIEFCKSKACADHWAEEVELLQEEMNG